MGEAKRRRKVDSNYGKEVVSVQLDPNLSLPLSLEETQKTLRAENRRMEKGRVIYKELTYPVIFVPYEQTYQGERQLYSHIVFDPKQTPKPLNQKLIDKISRLACLKIIAKYKVKRIDYLGVDSVKTSSE